MLHITQQKLLRLANQHNLAVLSYRQMGRLIGDESAQKVKHHLNQLLKKGLISGNKEQGLIEPVAGGTIKDLDMVSIPILGSANCGDATRIAEQNIEGYLRVSKNLLRRKQNIFAIQAVGDSMNRAAIENKSIENGDYVLVDSSVTQPRNNTYVLSVIDGVANIKKFIKDDQNKQVVLMSESTGNYSPIYIHPDDSVKYLVNGEVVQVIKKPRL